MFDLDASKIGLGAIIMSSIFYWLIIAIGWKYNMHPSTVQINKNRVPYKFLYYGLCIYCMFAFLNGDYIHYWQLVNMFMENHYSYVEEIYQDFIIVVNGNYLLFRFGVWGLSVLCFYLSVKKLKLNKSRAVFILLSVYISLFSYARATLAMAILFLGCSILFSAKTKNLKSIVVGITLIILSTMFHKSIIAAIFCVFLGYILKFKKSSIILILCLFPAFLILVNMIFSNLLQGNIIGDETSIDRLQMYSEKESIDKNIFGILRTILGLIAFYTPIVALIASIYLKKTYKYVSKPILKLFNSALIIVLLGLCLEMLGPESKILGYRIRYMAFIPLVLTLTYATDLKIIKFQWYRLCIICGLFSYAYINLYAIYQFFK